MGRGPRIQYNGALYHVVNRGNFKRDIFESEGARCSFEACLFEGCAEAGWRLHAFAIMRNHFHLAVETPRPNLAEGMQWIQGTFAARFIRFRSERGHLFESRYKSPLLEPGPLLLRVVDYIHLNPVRAGAAELGTLAQHRWSSFHWFNRPDRPDFMDSEQWHRELGIADNDPGWQAYQNHLQWLLADPSTRQRDEKELTRGWAIGSPTWKRDIALRYRPAVGRHRMRRSERAEIDEEEWRTTLDDLLEKTGRNRTDIAGPKSAAWKVDVALELRQLTNATNAWIARALDMGLPDSVSAYLSRAHRIRQPRR